MLLAQDVKQEEFLNEERRAALTVLRTANALKRKPNRAIFCDILTKQGAKMNQKESERIVTLTKDDLKWYHSKEEIASGNYLGWVKLQFIYQVMKSQLAKTDMPAILLHVSLWHDKKK